MNKAVDEVCIMERNFDLLPTNISFSLHQGVNSGYFRNLTAELLVLYRVSLFLYLQKYYVTW